MTPRATAALFSAPFALLLAASVAGAQLPDNTRIEIDPTADPDPAYRETLEERERQILDEAAASGESALPLAIGPGREEGAEPEPAEAQPAVYGAAAQPEVAAPAQPAQPRAPAPASPYEEYRGAAGGRDIANLLDVLIEEWSRPGEVIAIAYPADPPAGEAAAPSASAPSVPLAPPGVAPGAALYARTLYEANSDWPGPVLIEVLEPPLAGAVASGSFQRVRDRLVLRLTSLSHEGRRREIDGWAVGLDCACFAVEGEVERHWFDRVLLPAALNFATGWLDAASRAATTVQVQGDVVISSSRELTEREQIYEGLAAATQTVGAVLTEDAPVAMTVRIPRGAELALVLVDG